MNKKKVIKEKDGDKLVAKKIVRFRKTDSQEVTLQSGHAARIDVYTEEKPKKKIGGKKG